jgi:hypothetical protein
VSLCGNFVLTSSISRSEKVFPALAVPKDPNGSDHVPSRTMTGLLALARAEPATSTEPTQRPLLASLGVVDRTGCGADALGHPRHGARRVDRGLPCPSQRTTAPGVMCTCQAAGAARTAWG